MNKPIETEHKLRNLVHSALLIGGMALVTGLCGYVLFGTDGIVLAFGAIVVALTLSPSVPPSFVLSMYGAQQIPAGQAPFLHDIVDELSRRADLPARPKLYVMPSPMMNAFSLGKKNDAAIGMTHGLLAEMNRAELAGILAHELSHIASNDLWVMNLANTMSRATSLLSYFGMFLLLLNMPLILFGEVSVPWSLVLVLILAPTLISLLQLALSRAREYEADLNAARLLGDPEAVAAALIKLEKKQGRFWERLVGPGRQMPEPSLLRTHPKTEDRVARLRALQEADENPSPLRGMNRTERLGGWA